MKEHCNICEYKENGIASEKCVKCKYRGEKFNESWDNNFEPAEPKVLTADEIVQKLRIKVTSSNNWMTDDIKEAAEIGIKNGELSMWLKFERLTEDIGRCPECGSPHIDELLNELNPTKEPKHD